MNSNPYILLLFISVIIASFSQILLKKGTLQKYSSVYKEYINAYVIIGYVLMMLTTLINIVAYSKGVKYKNGPIIETLGLILVMLMSRVSFGEKVNLRKSMGNILILLGVVIFYL